MSVIEALQRMQTEVEKLGDRDMPADAVGRVDFRLRGDGAHIFFYGASSGEPYYMMMDAIGRDPIAPALCSLTLDGPDIGVNGTCEWSVGPLACSSAGFPLLRSLHFPQIGASDHNRTVLGSGDEDTIAALVARMPVLRSLTLPSPPAKAFFNTPLPHLYRLSVDAGCDPLGFIPNLAGSDSLPRLGVFEWGEYAETYMDDWRSQATPFSDFAELFRSRAFDKIELFSLKNPVHSDDELAGLAAIRPAMQFKIVHASHSYVPRP